MEVGRGKERILRGKEIKIYHMYILEDSIIKPTKHCLKKEEERKGMGI
jgi:hypothetical protein